jgi:deoxyribonuclease-4
MPHDKLLIGAHTSIAGGVHHALLEGKAIGATTVQIFTANQKRWEGKPLSKEAIDQWNETLSQTEIEKVMSHDSYLINLGSPNPETLEKSINTFKSEIARCHLLNLSFLNFHPGAYLTSSAEACLDQIIASLKSLKSLIHKGHTRLLIETTAGQGTCVGHNFEQIGYLIDRLKSEIPIGVCIDTCHIFAAGYDIRTEAGWNATLNQFDQHIGTKHLYALHVNDSMKPLGSKRDRHADLGEGEIGIECFKVMMRHPILKAIPKYLETPSGPARWKEEIAMLRNFSK